MKSLIISLAFVLFAFHSSFAKGYKIGDVAGDFKLKNVDEKMVSLADFPEAKGFIVVFTCNHCPVAKAYESRLLQIDAKYKQKGYPVIAINPNDPAVQPEDSFEQMQVYAKKKKFTFPYLFDDGQHVYPKFGATRTPHVFVLQKDKSGLVVRYIGAIDNNHRNPADVTEKYLEDAVDALLKNKLVKTPTTVAVGCTIKVKK
jgi:peroxiredoxin